MNRILKRPMFRRGGAADGGITSGLRTGYKNGLGVSSPEFASKMERLKNQGGSDVWGTKVSDYLKGDKTFGELRDLSREIGYKPRGTNVYDFMTEMGLDLASRPAAGNIWQQMATSAKGPYERFTQRKGEAAEQEYASQADIFKTLLTGASDVLAAEKEGKGWLEQWKFEQIPILNETIARLSKKEEAGPLSEAEVLELQTAKDRRSRIVGLDPVVEAHIQNNKFLVDDEIARLWVEDKRLPEDEQKYKTKKDVELQLDAIDSLRKRFGLAKGGRVGYQNAGAVMPGQGGVMPDQGVAMPGQVGPVIPSDATMAPQEETMPSELGGITYEELRSRLPQTITNDIVRLLVTSSEALEDFATIQTEQDVASFNRKYNVNLVLPAGG